MAPLEDRLSPDGRYFAFFVTRGPPLYGALQRVLPPEILARTGEYYIEGTDMTVGVAAWTGNDSVTFYLQPDSLPRHQWIRYRTAVPPTGWLVDTISPK